MSKHESPQKFHEEPLDCSSCKNLTTSASSVLSSSQLHPGPNDSCYNFMCSKCTDGKPAFQHTPKTWTDVALTALHNLERLEKRRFFLPNEICGFVGDHWDELCIGKTKTSIWSTSLINHISSRKTLFESSSEGEDDTRYALHRSLKTDRERERERERESRESHERKSRERKSRERESRERKSRERESRERERDQEPDQDQDQDEDQDQDQDQDLDQDLEDQDQDQDPDPPPRLKNSKSGTSTPEQSVKRKSKHRREQADDGGFMWCHQCKQKHVQVLYCSRTCSKKYCTRCVKRHYREKVEEIDLSQWVCYYCQGVCTCAFCRRRRAKETNTKFESHRGKKRKIEVDLSLEDPIPKRRRLKSSGGMTEGKSKDDDWIVEDDDDQALRPIPFKHSSPSSRRRFSRPQRVTLTDLLEARLISVGDQLIFRNAPESPAILLRDGRIRGPDTVIYRSLSTYAKKVAPRLGVGIPGSLYNGWRVIYCRGKMMDEIRNQYLKLAEKNSMDDFRENFSEEENSEYEEAAESEEGDGGDGDDTHVAPSSSPPEGNLGDEDEGGEDSYGRIGYGETSPGKEDSADSAGDPGVDSVRDSFLDSSESPRDGMGERSVDLLKEIRQRETKVMFKEVENNELSLWWIDDEEDEVESSPVHHHLDDLLPVSHISNVEEEQDVLVIGPQDSTSLDIRDKDFFNVASGDDGGTISIHLPRPASHLEDSVLHPFVTVTEEFYSGGVGIDMDD